MLKVYYVNTELFDTERILNKFIKHISEERKARVWKYKYEADKKRTIMAGIILNYLLTNLFNFDIKEDSFSTTKYGKPYIKNSEICFNISHSGKYIICAISDSDVGVDIERYGEDKKKLLNLFHKNDIANIGPDFNFYDLWSLKESYVKYLGLGLRFSLKSFFVTNEDEKTKLYRVDKKFFKGNIEKIKFDEEYSCSICYDAKKINLLKEIKKEEIEKFVYLYNDHITL